MATKVVAMGDQEILAMLVVELEEQEMAMAILIKAKEEMVP